jgi:crotonobetainyl-CoA:carnitine CoA-transferase CaiB-like acyl-CoA transferase
VVLGVLSGYHVLDLVDDKGIYCSRLLSGMGAEVTRSSRETLHEAVKAADVLIESFPPGYLSSQGLGYPELSQNNPGLVMASITPFGQDGPYQDFPACDLTLQGLGGWLSITGDPRVPLKLFGCQAYHTASLFAVNSILLALWRRHTTGCGQYLDISIMECVTASLDHILPRFFYGGAISRKQGSLHWNNAFRVFRCKDGYILLSLRQNWETLVEWLVSEGIAADLVEARWRDVEERNMNIGRIIEVLENWTSVHNVEELVENGQLMHFPWAEVKNS